MPTTHDKIVQYLHEAHAMELGLVRTLQAHVAMTPAGPYRTELDRHLRETRGHADGIARRLRELDQGPSFLSVGVGLAQRTVGQLLALGKAPLDMVARGGSPEEKLLKNAKDECASEALKIATYDALEAARAPSRRHRDRQARDQPPRRRGAHARGAARAASAADGRGRRRRGAREAEPRRRSRRRAPLPLPRYDELTVDEVTSRLNDLTPAQLRHVATYERAHKRRRGVLDAVDQHQVVVG